ncbi:tetratricopeptide repeat protein [Azospirillum canadense]|uniref:tetratricopeptide repeat protein n=1 Tax=Azospirillum canadense TaxID=403962 RepID=UPI0022261D7E|nr:tetratricopeptide repeat protein [Azospirillum canadense]MCW2236296.1 tetratricopeptide (TPR) repeat protein [Azospirillum canadense]
MTGGADASGAGSVAVGGKVDGSIIAPNATINFGNSVPPPSFSPLHQLPSDLPDFTGRAAEVDQLVAALDREHGGAAAVSAIRGMGGIGKTTLAVRAARRLLQRYPDAQIMINLQGHGDAAPLTPLEAMAHVVRAFHPDMKAMDDPQQMAAVYRSVLEGKRALILLDNADNTDQVEPLVPPPPCGLMVTAREPIHLDGAFPLKLDLLPRIESITLLRTAARPQIATDAEWDRIADICDDLPLALSVAGSYLAHAEDCSAADYIDDLTEESTRLSYLKVKKDRGDVRTILAHSARRLAETDKDLAALWQTLTVFPADFDRAAVAAVWNAKSERNAVTLLRALLTRGLILFDDMSKRYRLHDLMRPVALTVFAAQPDADPHPRSSQRLEEARSTFTRYFKSVLEAANTQSRQGPDNALYGQALYDREALNILAAAEWALNNRESHHRPTPLSTSLSGSKTPDQLFWLEAAQKAARALGNKLLEEIHLGSLGNAYADLGEMRRAIDHHQQSLALARETGNRRSEMIRLGSLGNAFASLGETQVAIEYHEQSLAISREIGDQHCEGNRLGSLGNAYGDLGETRRAIEHYEMALAIAREIGNRHSEGIHIGNLGNTYASMGEMHRAIEHYKMALAIAREIGNRHSEEIHIGNLGNTYASLGELQRAIEHYEMALTLAREIGNRHSEGIWLGGLGAVYADLGEIERARKLTELALAIFETIEGPYAAIARRQLIKLR